MRAEDYFWIGASLLSLYLASQEPWIDIPKYLKEDLEKAGIEIEKGVKIVTPKLQVEIIPIEPEEGKKYYPWYGDGEIRFRVKNLSERRDLYIYVDLRIDYPPWYQIVISSLKATFPFLEFVLLAGNILLIHLIKSALGQDYIRLTLDKGQEKEIRIQFPWIRFSIPLPFVYTEHTLIIKVMDGYGNRVIKEVKYIIGYP